MEDGLLDAGCEMRDAAKKSFRQPMGGRRNLGWVNPLFALQRPKLMSGQGGVYLIDRLVEVTGDAILVLDLG